MINKLARRRVRVGTRGSSLALAQARQAIDCLSAGSGRRTKDFTILPIRTQGDKDQTSAIHEIGGKGVFCKEIEHALLSGEIDIAVHSMKDLPVRQPDGLIADCVLPREDPRDALIAPHSVDFCDLPDGAVIGTASLRRSAQIRHHNPKLKPAFLRGNLDSRLSRLAEKKFDAIVVAMAGLRRMEVDLGTTTPIPTSIMKPAAAQGVICLERRADDHAIGDLFTETCHSESLYQAVAERSFLAGLGGDCTAPIGVLATINGSVLTLSGELLSADGQAKYAANCEGQLTDANELGLDLARRVLFKHAQGRTAV